MRKRGSNDMAEVQFLKKNSSNGGGRFVFYISSKIELFPEIYSYIGDKKYKYGRINQVKMIAVHLLWK